MQPRIIYTRRSSVLSTAFERARQNLMTRNGATAKPSASGLAVSGIDASVEVRRHPAARRLTLRVSRTRRAVIVTLPIGSDFGDAGSFVNTHIDWVRARLQDVPDPMPFADGSAVPVRGTIHR